MILPSHSCFAILPAGWLTCIVSHSDSFERRKELQPQPLAPTHRFVKSVLVRSLLWNGVQVGHLRNHKGHQKEKPSPKQTLEPVETTKMNENEVIESCRHFTMMHTAICMGARDRMYRDGQGGKCERNMVTQDVTNTSQIKATFGCSPNRHPEIFADNVSMRVKWPDGVGCALGEGWGYTENGKRFLRGELFKPSCSKRTTGRLRIIAAIKKTHPKAMMFDSARFAKWVAKTSDFLPV